MISSILILLAIICVVVFIHEMGHYVAARSLGVPVPQFSVGFGKSLLSFNTKRTQWHLRLVPLGGYVMMDEDALTRASPWRKFIIFIAGPAANLLPFIALGAYLVSLPATLHIMWLFYELTVLGVVEVLAQPLHYLGIIGDAVEPAMKAGKAVGEAATTDSGLSGPIGAAAMQNNVAAKFGSLTAGIIMFGAMSVGLGLFNLLPLPPLDGGRMVVACCEGALGARRSEVINRWLTGIGSILLLWLFISITIGDISKLVS